MTEIQFASLQPFVEALGWTLVHFVWQGAAVGLIFAVVMRLSRHTSPNWRYLVGLICMAASLILPILTYLYVYSSGASMASIGTAVAVSAPAIATAMASAGWIASVESYIAAYLPWIVGAWGVGVLMLTLRVCLGWRRLGRLGCEGVAAIPQDLSDRVTYLRNLFGVRQTIVVLESTRVGVPTVMGWLRPVILIPTSCLLGLSREQLELVIAHELGHIRRWDYLINLAQVFIETVLFYHPVVRWISRRVREEREQCCDDLVLRHCGKPVQYAKALANLETMRGGWMEPALAATGGQLVARIERIVGGNPEPRTERVNGNSLVLGLIVAVVVIVSQLNQRPLEQVIEAPVLQPSIEFNEVEATSPTVMPEPVTNTPALFQQADPADAIVASSIPARIDEVAVTASRRSAIELAETTLAETTTVQQAVSEPILSQPVPDRNQPANREQPVPEPARSAPADNSRSLTELEITPAPASRQMPAQAEPPKVQKQSGPVPVRRVAPAYPRRARVGGLEGTVTVEFSVRRDGSVTNVVVLDSHPRRVFDREARRAISKWIFDPATVSSATPRLTQLFEFNLNHKAAPASADEQSEAYRTCNRVTGTRICLEDEF